MKNKPLILLESLNWKSGDFVSDYGYYYGAINNKFIFLPDQDYPFEVKEFLDMDNMNIGFKKRNRYIINNIEYRIPKFKELVNIIKYRDTSFLSEVEFPTRLYVSDRPNYYFDMITNTLQPLDHELRRTDVLLINSVTLNSR